ncbi:transcriptional regulator FtsR [Corynebacterium kalidii]|uniref:MerR family transcriptional regulator n=1 Tax=Corynebacterium kalidii TaxID=2931982 RepID=A0A9X2B3K9_9CORY|nr:MerR family transcriptional regulator [Corynebacterium kalidii]
MSASAAAAGQSQPEPRPATGRVLPTSSIGDVLKQLQGDFPDVTVSKIRFLEAEGLVTPQRSKSGYRRFSPEDISRLRYILANQRDSFLPLKVIKEQLEAMDSGKVTPVDARRSVAGTVTPDQFRQATVRRLTRADVASRAGVEESFIASLVKISLLTPDAAGFFSVDDVDVVRIAAKMGEYGIDNRHLKTLATQAQRQADLVNQVAGPVAHGRDENARERSAELSREVSALVVSLHAALIKGKLPR